MIAILGSLSLYKSLTKASVDATFDSRHNGSISLAITQLGTQIQNAGFGLSKPDAAAAPPVTNHIVTNAGELIWRSADIQNIATFDSANPLANGVICHRLREAQGANNTVELIIESTKAAACDSTSSLVNISGALWPSGDASSTTRTVSSISLNRLSSEFQKSNTAQSLITFTVTPDVSCSPYSALPEAPPGTLVQIDYLTSVDLNSEINVTNTANTPSVSDYICVVNG